MLKHLLILLMLLLAVPGVVIAAVARNQQIGVVVGEPTGLTALWQQGNDRALSMALAWSLVNSSYIYFRSDYLFYNERLLTIGNQMQPVYFGLGASIRMGSVGGIALRLPVGIEYIFYGSPLIAFAELAPAINIIPATSLDLNLGLGLRYTFR